jgi:MerR family transcriptional regulator, copper efflux regulator
MRIGELASVTGVSVRVLRHYEAQGLIQSSRSANGYREYPKVAMETVRQIRLLLDCGFGTRQIYGFLPCFSEGENFDAVTCAAGLEQFLAKRDELDQLIKVLKQRRDRLSDRIERFSVPPSTSQNKKGTT